VIINVKAKHPSNMGMSVGEYDIQKKRLVIGISPVNEKNMYRVRDFELPAGLTEVFYEDRNWGHIYQGSVEHFNSLLRDKEYILVDITDKGLKKIR
jgi:hypothetical protein